MTLSLIILQAASSSNFAGGIVTLIIGIAIFLGIFLLIRSIMLWYWKIDIIVTNQEQHTALLKRQIALLEQQNQLLTVRNKDNDNLSGDTYTDR